jgi:hypothetical protein
MAVESEVSMSISRPAPRIAYGLLAILSAIATSARADHDPARTATLYVHGFDLAGASRAGVYGDEFHEAVADSIAALARLPVSHAADGPLPPNVVIGVRYYGDTAPSWYTATDRADVDAVTAAWGGGVPRYATIVAKFARRVLQRSGASQLNVVSASFGSLVARWMIEQNVEGLASDGRIARWLNVEGVLGGNWAASHADALSALDVLSLEPIDIEHMTHDWIDAHIHLPHGEADSPRYAGILVGQIASTDDRYNDSALSLAMAVDRDWQPNDGVQALPDARFQSVTAQSQLMGLPPTFALFHATHFGLKDVRGAWADAATFLTQRRRVTVTMTSATVTNLHEPELPFWDWRPGEIVFESRVHSPAVARRWGISDPVCAIVEAGGAAPIRRFNRDGETQAMDHVVFDDFVLAEETALDVELRAYDVDLDPHYGVYETVIQPYLDDLGAGTISVSTLAPGTYTFGATDWNCRLSVSVVDYPFDAFVGVPDPVRDAGASLSLSPNPTRGAQRIVAPGAASGPASLDILDVGGRVVRHVIAVPRSGWVWDGRDAEGRRVRAGVYLIRVATPSGTWHGRSCVIL